MVEIDGRPAAVAYYLREDLKAPTDAPAVQRFLDGFRATPAPSDAGPKQCSYKFYSADTNENLSFTTTQTVPLGLTWRATAEAANHILKRAPDSFYRRDELLYVLWICSKWKWLLYHARQQTQLMYGFGLDTCLPTPCLCCPGPCSCLWSRDALFPTGNWSKCYACPRVLMCIVTAVEYVCKHTKPPPSRRLT